MRGCGRRDRYGRIGRPSSWQGSGAGRDPDASSPQQGTARVASRSRAADECTRPPLSGRVGRVGAGTASWVTRGLWSVRRPPAAAVPGGSRRRGCRASRRTVGLGGGGGSIGAHRSPAEAVYPRRSSKDGPRVCRVVAATGLSRLRCADEALANARPFCRSGIAAGAAGTCPGRRTARIPRGAAACMSAFAAEPGHAEVTGVALRARSRDAGPSGRGAIEPLRSARTGLAAQSRPEWPTADAACAGGAPGAGRAGSARVRSSRAAMAVAALRAQRPRTPPSEHVVEGRRFRMEWPEGGPAGGAAGSGDAMAGIRTGIEGAGGGSHGLRSAR